MDRRWICNDVWMDILPSFDRPQLGLKLALLSDRFDVLVDTHFDAKTTELTLWREITIQGRESILSVRIDGTFMAFPLPDHPLPNKIRFHFLRIKCIDHSVLAFLRANQQIWDRSGINLKLYNENLQPIWDVLAREIWPIFATNIRHLYFPKGAYLDNLRLHISPTILTDLDQLTSIDSGRLLPDGIADDGPNATSGQALSKWLHTPSKNGQPKQLHRKKFSCPLKLEWVNNFKEKFRHATTSVSYHIQLYFLVEPTPIGPFELVNEVTKEKLTLKVSEEYNGALYNWLLQRSLIGETAKAAVKWKTRKNSDANFNYIRFDLRYGNNSGANLNKILIGLH